MGLNCVRAGYGWCGSRYICVQTPYYRSYYAAHLKSPTAAAAGAEASAATDAAAAADSRGVEASVPSDAKNMFCSKMGGLCGRNVAGRQCCGPKANCIVGDGLVARCMPRDSCMEASSKCSGVGQCCSGHVCKEGQCVRAECKVPSNCQPRGITRASTGMS
jgi:hypothetical protein